jgi:amino acid adenylation domain-containing protein
MNGWPLDRRLAARADSTPAATAFEFESSSMSYGELDQISNRAARWLRAHGAGLETIVAIDLPLSAEAMVVVWGVIKIGAAYLAIGRSDPTTRVGRVLRDSGAAILVTDRPGSLGRLFAGTTITPRDLAASTEPVSRMESPAGPTNAFQLVYTSGTTGSPRGVVVPGSAIIHRIDAMRAQFPLRASDVALVHRPLAVVGSAWDCFGPLLEGVPSIVIEGLEPGAGKSWRRLCDARVSHMAAAPAVWDLVLDQVERRPGEWRDLRLAITGGQPLTAAFVRRWHAAFPHGTLLNVYGLTECAYVATAPAGGLDEESRDVPVGSPFPGVTLSVLSGEQPAPDGAPGEIHVGGGAVARGYVNDPVETASRFLPDPESTRPGAVRFRTGDLGYWSHGVLRVCGRADRQAKIHGNRVSLSEVEAVLSECRAVRAAAVVAEGAYGAQELVAYVVAANGEVPTAQWLRTQLRELLPGHMIPTRVVALSALPFTQTGKIDYQRLRQLPTVAPAVDEGNRASVVVSEATRIWRSILGITHLSPRDNFYDLGGDSLAAMRIAAEMRDALGVEVGVTEVLEHPTIGALATILISRVATGDGAKPVEVARPVPANGATGAHAS